MSKLRVGVFHPGTQHSWQTALAFQESDQLVWYATSIFYDPAIWPYRLERMVPPGLGKRLHRDFQRRYLPALSPTLVRQFGYWEWAETIARRLGAHQLADSANERGNIAFGKRVIRLIEREPVDVVWGYNTSALEVFRWAKPRGIRCVLDQTIGHCASFDRVMAREYACHPQFFLRPHAALPPSAVERQNEELALADVVVVGSDSCAGTLIENGCAPEKIRIVPYGYDESVFPALMPERRPMPDRPVEFLFVGQIHPRKGIAHLLRAFDQIPSSAAKLTLVGGLAVPTTALEPYRHRVRHINSLPRSEVVAHFLAADCFIFPSLFEGSAIVLNEAIGAGLGIIQSRAAGDGVRDGANGEVIDEISADHIVQAVSRALDARQRLLTWQEASWEQRMSRTWGGYRRHIGELPMP
ncbi:MAG TPA: glycosyltransferase family 4 protein [Stellaceae bacterium]|nr:glycosyltransferase family 4 protein [Stellaceae bacterium]